MELLAISSRSTENEARLSRSQRIRLRYYCSRYYGALWDEDVGKSNVWDHTHPFLEDETVLARCEKARAKYYHALIKHEDLGKSNVLDHIQKYRWSDIIIDYLKSANQVIATCLEYLKLGLYEKTPESLEMDSKCLVARCKKCKLKEKALSSFPSKIENL